MIKKQNLILWIAAFVITFLAGYFHSITDKTYPVSGTIYINSKPVYYRLEKIHKGEKNFRILIRTDLKEIEAKAFWREVGKTSWYSVKFSPDSVFLKAEIPSVEINRSYEYYCTVIREKKEYRIPQENTIRLEVKGKVPALINLLNWVFLSGSLLLSTRTGLEYFKEKDLIKKFSVITVLFLAFLFILSPLVRSYESGAINKFIPSLPDLFSLSVSLMFATWIIGMIFTFYLSERKIPAAAASVLTIIIYLTVR
ncbi:MAG: hypothetical protein Kow0098_14500 [Ignavibacteriaceae bacterium]